MIPEKPRMVTHDLHLLLQPSRSGIRIGAWKSTEKVSCDPTVEEQMASLWETLSMGKISFLWFTGSSTAWIGCLFSKETG